MKRISIKFPIDTARKASSCNPRRGSGSALVYVVLIMSVATAVALAGMAAVLNDARYARSTEAASEAEIMAQSALQEARADLSKNILTGQARYFKGDTCTTLVPSGEVATSDCPHYTFATYTKQNVIKDHPYEFWTSDFFTGVEKVVDLSDVTRGGLVIEVLQPDSVAKVFCKMGPNLPDTEEYRLIMGAKSCAVGDNATKVYLKMTYVAAPSTHQPLLHVFAADGGSSGATGKGTVSFGERIQVEAVGYSSDGSTERRYSMSRYNPGSYQAIPGGSVDKINYTYVTKAVTGIMNHDNGYCSVLNACR